MYIVTINHLDFLLMNGTVRVRIYFILFYKFAYIIYWDFVLDDSNLIY